MWIIVPVIFLSNLTKEHFYMVVRKSVYQKLLITSFGEQIHRKVQCRLCCDDKPINTLASLSSVEIQSQRFCPRWRFNPNGSKSDNKYACTLLRMGGHPAIVLSLKPVLKPLANGFVELSVSNDLSPWRTTWHVSSEPWKCGNFKSSLKWSMAVATLGDDVWAAILTFILAFLELIWWSEILLVKNIESDCWRLFCDSLKRHEIVMMPVSAK